MPGGIKEECATYSQKVKSIRLNSCTVPRKQTHIADLFFKKGGGRVLEKKAELQESSPGVAQKPKRRIVEQNSTERKVCDPRKESNICTVSGGGKLASEMAMARIQQSGTLLKLMWKILLLGHL